MDLIFKMLRSIIKSYWIEDLTEWSGNPPN